MELMDSETGEILFQRSTNLECHNLDLETGEILEECDESEVDESQQKLHFVARKSKFNVPKALIKEPKCESNAKFDCYLSSQESFSLTNKKRVIDLKEVNIDKIYIFAGQHLMTLDLSILGNHFWI